MTKEILPLRDYQEADLTFYLTQDRCANLSDAGVGKTAPTCLYSYLRWCNDQAKSVWVQPGSLLEKNRVEFMRFTPFTDEDVMILHGSPKQRTEVMRRQPRVILTTAEMLSKYADQFPQDYQLLAIDEWHQNYKTITSKRTQALIRFMRTRKWMVAMSGTLIHGRLDSVYPFIHLVNGKYYYDHNAFVRQHAQVDPFGNNKIIGWNRNLQKVAAILGRHGIRRTRLDVYGPDAIVRQIERVEMVSKQRARYDELHEKALIELENEILESGSPLSLARAILEHPEAVPRYEIDLDTGKRARTGEFVDLMHGELTGKDERLLVHVADHINAGTPFVYFGALQKQLERVQALLEKHGVRTGLIHGGVPNKRRVEVDEAFRAGELQAIATSALTGGTGSNWQWWGPRKVEVSHCIFGSLDYLDTSITQGESRFCRETRREPLLSTILEYERSIDQRIFSLVQEKSETANAVDATRAVIELKRKARAA